VSNLEPDLGESTSAVQRSPAPAPTITVTPRNPLAPRLPDELQAKINAYEAGTLTAPTTPIPSTGLDTTSIITNLPDARKSFVTKYTRLKKTVQALPEPVRKSIVQMDLDRANKGQGPMNDQETLAAIITTMRNEPATKEPEDKSILGTIKAIPGNAVDDAGNILKSLPSVFLNPPIPGGPRNPVSTVNSHTSPVNSDSLATASSSIVSSTVSPLMRPSPPSSRLRFR